MTRGPEAQPRHDIPFFSRIFHRGPSTPGTIAGIVNELRHPNGRVNGQHPAIDDVMREAKKNRFDVGLVPKGLHTFVVWGENLINKTDKKKVVTVSAGAAITAATVAGATIIALRRHKRPH